MRYSHSPDFGIVLRAHQEAYAAFDVLAEAGADGTPEYIAADEAEHVALNALMAEPAQSPGDVLAKIRLYLDREMYSWNGPRDPDAADAYRAILEADLLNLNRPCTSRQMDEAFATWAATWAALAASSEEDGNTGREAVEANTAAEKALWALPCVSPGDYIVKDYIDQLGSQGPEPGTMFLIKDWSDDHEVDGMLAVSDLEDCDLGRCMMTLGRTNFDAQAWILATQQVGGHFKLMIDHSDDGARTFWQGMDIADNATKGERKAHRLLQMLIGGEFHVERTKAVCDLIERDYPEHRMSANQKAAREAGILGDDNAGNGTKAKVEA